MRVKKLANTGFEIPEIGVGTWQYRGGAEPLRRGISCGAYLIDTAEAYGTEGVVGEAIRGIRDEVFIATKVSPSHFRHDDLIRSADLSLKRMGIDYIDLYQLHWPSLDVPIEVTMAAMDELVEARKVRFVGVSNFSLRQLMQAQAASANKIVSNQVRYNLVDREIERDLLPYCQENDVTVIAYSPLAHGLRHLRAELGGTLEQIARGVGKTEAQVALNWLVSRENVVAIPKSNSAERIIENCGASDWRLSGEDLKLLEGALVSARRG